MKTLGIVFGIAVAMVTVPAWAASSGSLHAMSKVSAASALSSDELSAVEGGIITFGHQETTVYTASQSQFLGWVLQQQYGVGYQPLVVKTVIVPQAGPYGGITFIPDHQVRVNTLVCGGCWMP